MSASQLSILFALIAVGLGIGAWALLKPDRTTLLAALAGGLAVSVFDVFGVVVAHRMDWWHLKGAWMVGPVPMVLNVGWIFLGGAYCLVWHRFANPHPTPLPSRERETPSPRRGEGGGEEVLRKTAVILATAAYGPINDGFLMRFGVFSLGEGMRLPYTFPYWLLSILITLGAFRLALERQTPTGPRS